jgi:hypothetical protein
VGKRGPKSSFNDKIRETILRLIKEGKTEIEISKEIGVCRKTLNNWKGEHADLLKAVHEARLIPDQLVEVSLFQRALGYSHPEEKIIQTRDGGLETVTVTKHHPPDTTAAIFWLRNRQKKRWSEKNESDVTVNNNIAGSLTDDQLDAKIAEKLAKAEAVALPTKKAKAKK